MKLTNVELSNFKDSYFLKCGEDTYSTYAFEALKLLNYIIKKGYASSGTYIEARTRDEKKFKELTSFVSFDDKPTTITVTFGDDDCNDFYYSVSFFNGIIVYEKLSTRYGYFERTFKNGSYDLNYDYFENLEVYQQFIQPFDTLLHFAPHLNNKELLPYWEMIAKGLVFVDNNDLLNLTDFEKFLNGENSILDNEELGKFLNELCPLIDFNTVCVQKYTPLQFIVSNGRWNLLQTFSDLNFDVKILIAIWVKWKLSEQNTLLENPTKTILIKDLQGSLGDVLNKRMKKYFKNVGIQILEFEKWHKEVK